MKKFFKIALCSLAGLAVGVTFANLSSPGYKHGMVMLMPGKGAEAKPFYFNGNNGRQVLALSVKNHQRSKNIEFRMEGAEMQSWYPPVIRMPFSHGVSFDAGKFKGVDFNKSLPVYVVFDDDGTNRKLEIIDSTTGSLIQTVDVARGKGNERRNH